MTTTTIRNGIDVGQLVETIEAVTTDKDVGTFTFRASSVWQDGTHNIGSIQGFTHAGTDDDSRDTAFTLEGDEPPVLLGRNKGPNAVELVLQSLAFCYAVGYVANAAAQGIDLDRLEFVVEGDFDARSFLGQDGPRPGFTKIRARARVASPNADDQQLRELCEYVQRSSPVRDMLANPVPVATSLEIL